MQIMHCNMNRALASAALNTGWVGIVHPWAHSRVSICFFPHMFFAQFNPYLDLTFCQPSLSPQQISIRGQIIMKEK